METDTDMHDGSPLGNGHVNAKIHAGLAICPYQGCSSRGGHWKCYQDCFESCVTYLLRKGIGEFELGPDSELVDIISD